MEARRLDLSIDRSSPVPLYHQLAQQLTAAITDGRLQPGDPFENEVALGERLGLSRPTVRQAISELVDQGLLLRRRGLGTTVASRKVHRNVELSSLFDDLERAGRSPRTEVVELGTTTDERAATGLDLPPDTPLLAVVRVRYAGDLPLAVLRNWLPPAHDDLGREELETQGLYAALRARGVRPVVARQTVGARVPTAAEKRLLATRGPVLTMTRMAFDAAGVAVEFGDHSYRASDYSIEMMVDER